MMRSRWHVISFILLTTDVCYNSVTWVCSRRFSSDTSCRRCSLNLPRQRRISRKESLRGSFSLGRTSEITSSDPGGEQALRKVKENVVAANHILASIMSDLDVQRDDMSAFLEEIGASTTSSSEVEKNGVRANNLLANIIDDPDTRRDEIPAFAKEIDVPNTSNTEVSGTSKPMPVDISADWLAVFMGMDANSDNIIDCKEAFAAGMSHEDFEVLSNNGDSIGMRAWLSAKIDFKRAATKQYQGPPNTQQSADAPRSACGAASQREYLGRKMFADESRYKVHAPTMQKRTSDWSRRAGDAADALASRKTALADERQRQSEAIEERMMDSFMNAAAILQKDGRLVAEIAEIIEEQSEHSDGRFDDGLTRT